MAYSAQHYAQHDSSFVNDLHESDEYVWKAAHWLRDLGFVVTVRPVHVRPDETQMAEYADRGDLEIIQRVEVKRRKDIAFTGKDDYPFQTVFVDVAHTYDNARPKPFAYIIFNADASVCIVIKNDTAQYWQKKTHYDKAKQRQRTFYECPLEFCRFYTMK